VYGIWLHPEMAMKTLSKAMVAETERPLLLNSPLMPQLRVLAITLLTDLVLLVGGVE
jgi:hypothetical protein